MPSKESINITETVPGLVSVLIPAYNHEQYVQLTIRSIIGQTYQNIELIVVDDGSKDSTWKIINELRPECEKRFTNVVFYREENSGSVVALNKALEFAKGEFVYIIASDDLAFPEAISVQHQFLTTHPEYALVTGDNIFIDENGSEVVLDEYFNKATEESLHKFKTLHQHNKYKLFHINFNKTEAYSYNSMIFWGYSTNGYLIRREALDRIGNFTTEAPAEDLYLILQVAKYYKMKLLDQPLFYYRRHLANSWKPDKETFIQNAFLRLGWYKLCGYSHKRITLFKRYRKTFLYEKKSWMKKYPFWGRFIWWYYRFLIVPSQNFKYKIIKFLYH